jgi:hypothetical protein
LERRDLDLKDTRELPAGKVYRVTKVHRVLEAPRDQGVIRVQSRLGIRGLRGSKVHLEIRVSKDRREHRVVKDYWVIKVDRHEVTKDL